MIILHNSLPASCIRKVAMNSEEVLYNKIYESPRPPQRMVLKPTWQEGRKDTTKADEEGSGVTSAKNGRPVAVQTRTTTNFLKSITELKDYLIRKGNKKRQYTQRSRQKVDSSISDASRSRRAESRPEAKSSLLPIQRKVEEHDPQHGM